MLFHKVEKKECWSRKIEMTQSVDRADLYPL